MSLCLSAATDRKVALIRLVPLFSVLIWGPSAVAQLDIPSWPARAIVQDPTRCPHYAADLGIAASSSRLVLTSNCKVQIWNKTLHSLLAETYLHTPNTDGLFVRASNFDVFDPQIAWDEENDRFWICASERDDSIYGECRLRIAVSTTSSPSNWTTTGNSPSWRTYAYDINVEHPLGGDDPEGFADRPRIGISDDYVCIAFNDADNDDLGRLDDRTMVVIIPKAGLLSGNKPAIQLTKWIDHNPMTGEGTTSLHAVTTDGDMAPNDNKNTFYLVATEDRPRAPKDTMDCVDKNNTTECSPLQYYPQDSIHVGALKKVAGTWTYYFEAVTIPSGSEYKGVVGATYGSPQGQGQPNDTNPLISSMFTGIEYRSSSDRIWAVQHVRPVPPVDVPIDPNNRSVVQWYEIKTDGWPTTPGKHPSIVKARQVSLSGGDWGHDASIGVVGIDLLGISLVISDSDQYPAIGGFAKNGANESVGTDVGGVSCYLANNNDWIDFSGAAHDPADGCVIWGHSRLALRLLHGSLGSTKSRFRTAPAARGTMAAPTSTSVI